MNAFEIKNCQSCNVAFRNDEKKQDLIRHTGSLSGKVLCGVCFRNWKADFEIGAEFYAENGRKFEDEEI